VTGDTLAGTKLTRPVSDRREPAAPDRPTIAIRGLTKGYGSTPVLRSVDLDVPTGRVTAILGASGSGKTTLLRLIAGFDTADAGRIDIAGRTVDDGHRTVRPQHRGVGYVPQDAALFPHLTVLGNIAFGVPRRERSRLPRLIETVGLSGYEKRYPHQLSGGQQQRVALARALAIRPDVVLLDEPFGSLDAALRETVRGDVIDILARAGTTTVLVTHDQDEALSLADQIALIDGGRIGAYGSARDLYDHPPTPQIAAAIGTANLLPGHLRDGRVECALGSLPAPAHARQLTARACEVLLRPEQLELHTAVTPQAAVATVVDVRYHGHDTLVELTIPAASGGPDGIAVTARVAGTADLRPGDAVWVTTSATPHCWM
jgi:iron(III) transport system ATP-binding protein